MEKERLNICYLLIGDQGTGKTTIADKLAAASGKRRIVVDTDAHPFYAHYEVVNIEGLKDLKAICAVVKMLTKTNYLQHSIHTNVTPLLFLKMQQNISLLTLASQ